MLRVALLALVLFAAGSQVAFASCGCDRWTQGIYNQRELDLRLEIEMVTNGIAEKNRKKIRSGIYDWARNGYVSKSICDKIGQTWCRKARACIRAGGLAFIAARATGASWRNSMILGIVACVDAALATA
jgi:hypothetical protein